MRVFYTGVNISVSVDIACGLAMNFCVQKVVCWSNELP